MALYSICFGYKITFKAHVHVCPSDWNAANLVAEQILWSAFHQRERERERANFEIISRVES